MVDIGTPRGFRPREGGGFEPIPATEKAKAIKEKEAVAKKVKEERITEAKAKAREQRGLPPIEEVPEAEKPTEVSEEIKKKEIFVREVKKTPTGDEYGEWLPRKALEGRVSLEEKTQQQKEYEKRIEETLKKQKLYVVGGRIPEKEAKLKTWSQMTEEERKIAAPLPSAEKELIERGIVVKHKPPEEFKERLKWGVGVLQERYTAKIGKLEEKYFKGVEPSTPSIIRAAKKGEKLPIPVTLATVGYVGYTAGKTVFTIGMHPIQTAKGFYTMVRHPIKAAKEMYVQFKLKPIGTITETITTAYVFGKVWKVAKPVVKRPFQAAIKRVSSKYVPYEKTGVKVVEGVSIPTPLRELKGFERKTVPAVHTTLARQLKIGGVIAPSELKYLKGWRKDIGQRGFYTSSPVEMVIKKLTAEGKWIKTTYKKTPIQPRYQPTLYGGYIGIGEGYGASIVRFTLLPAKSRAFIFRETFIKPTPGYAAKMPIRKLVEWQSVRAGTRVAAENIKRLSTEGQFITSPGLEGKPLIRIAAGEGALKGKFTYYPAKKVVPPLFGGEKAPLFIRKGWEFLTTEQKKISFVEAKFEEIRPMIGVKPKEKAIDVGKYAESYGARYVSLVDISKPVIGLKPSIIKPEISKPKVSYPSVPISPMVSFPSLSVGSMVSSYASKVSSKVSPSSVSKSFSSSSSKASSSMASISSSVSSSMSSVSSSVSSSLKSSSSSFKSSSSASSSSLASSSSSSYSSSYSYGDTTTLIPIFLPKQREPLVSKAFRVELKRFGEFIPISKRPLPKGRALRLGAVEARRTLGATFRIVPTKELTRISDIAFKPSPLIFRGYKIEEGKKVPMPFTYIQFAKKRLSKRGEVREIMAARLKAPRKRF